MENLHWRETDSQSRAKLHTWNESCIFEILAIETLYLCFCSCDAHNGKICRGEDLWDGSLWVPGPVGMGAQLKWLREKAARQECEHCCSQLLPEGSQASWETLPEVNVCPGAAAREQGKAGTTEVHCIASLSCCIAVILLGCKDKFGAEGMDLQFVWRSLVRFSSWGHSFVLLIFLSILQK